MDILSATDGGSPTVGRQGHFETSSAGLRPVSVSQSTKEWRTSRLDSLRSIDGLIRRLCGVTLAEPIRWNIVGRGQKRFHSQFLVISALLDT